MKKQITILCCVLSVLFLFTGCNAKQVTIPSVDHDQILANIEVITDQIVADLPDEEGEAVVYYDGAYYNGQLNLDRKQWEEKQEILKSQHDLEFKSQKVYNKAIESYQKALVDSGNAVAINYETLAIGYGKEGGYEVTVDLISSNKNVEMALSYNPEMQITNAAFNVHYSIAENLKKAALNTLLGMGTVFVILILISLIISTFGLIPKLEASKKAKEKEKAKAAAPAAPAAPVTPVAVAEEEDLSDDLELVAVISAAIAAYEGSADASGYVVRSIRKSNNWHRA